MLAEASGIMARWQCEEARITTFRLKSDDGGKLDAHLDLAGQTIVYRSRGGKRGSKDARNLDYGPGLRLLLRRLQESRLGLEGVWLDSQDVQALDEDDRRIFGPSDWELDPAKQFALLSRRMQMFGRPTDAPYGGSRVKTIRLKIAKDVEASADDVPTLLGLEEVKSPAARLTPRPGPLEIWNAVQFLTKEGAETTPSTSRAYDVVVEGGARLDPDQVMETAARLAGAAVPADPDERRGILKDDGFQLVPHGDGPVSSSPAPLHPDDRSWAEGRPKFVTHLRRERAPGLSNAKKAQFRADHGRLFCQRCDLDPAKEFGDLGDACIEVHHRRVSVGDMADDHRTELADLECICANCHRITHAEMSRSAKAKT
jgi:hypothetical protein